MRQPGNRKLYSPNAIPVFSTDTVAEAEALITRTCRLMWDDKTYVFSMPWREGTIEGIQDVTDTLARLHHQAPTERKPE